MRSLVSFPSNDRHWSYSASLEIYKCIGSCQTYWVYLLPPCGTICDRRTRLAVARWNSTSNICEVCARVYNQLFWHVGMSACRISQDERRGSKPHRALRSECTLLISFVILLVNSLDLQSSVMPSNCCTAAAFELEWYTIATGTGPVNFRDHMIFPTSTWNISESCVRLSSFEDLH